MKLEEAFYKLRIAGVTDSIQMVRKWVRDGKIEGTMGTKQDGYDINPNSLDRFIRKRTNRYEQYFRSEFEKEYNIAEYKEKIKDLEERLEIEQERVKVFRAELRKIRK